jgi:hypothetical protein
MRTSDVAGELPKRGEPMMTSPRWASRVRARRVEGVRVGVGRINDDKSTAGESPSTASPC